VPVRASTLAESVPAAEWQDNVKGHILVPIDPASGQVLAEYEPIELGQAISHAFSPDQKTLAIVGFVSSEHPHGGSLHLINLRTWEDNVQELQLDSYVNAMDFSPDGQQLAISYGNTESRILVFDLSNPLKQSRSAILQNSLDFLVSSLKFTADGNGLMVYGSRIENRYTVNEMSPEPPIVALLERSDLRTRWESSLEGVRHGIRPKDENLGSTADLHQPGQAIYLFPGLVFAPGRDILYVVHADEEKLTTVDFKAEKVHTAKIQPRLTWIDRLFALTADVAHAKVAEGTSKRVAVSPDGLYLYIVGQQTDLIQDKFGEWQMVENPLGLQIVSTDDGSRLARYNTEASEVSISPDGQYLYLRGWDGAEDNSWTQIFDTTTKQIIARMDGMWLVPTRRSNGAPIFASSVWTSAREEYNNATFDSQAVLAEWIGPEYLAWLITP
jgi:WD40 repeat protein